MNNWIITLLFIAVISFLPSHMVGIIAMAGVIALLIFRSHEKKEEPKSSRKEEIEILRKMQALYESELHRQSAYALRDKIEQQRDNIVPFKRKGN